MSLDWDEAKNRLLSYLLTLVIVALGSIAAMFWRYGERLTEQQAELNSKLAVIVTRLEYHDRDIRDLKRWKDNATIGPTKKGN